MKKGMRVLLADGMFELKVVSASPGEVACKVIKGGVLKEGKGVNFPGLPLDLPSLTDKDTRDLGFLLREGVDYIALSFVRQAAVVQALKNIIRKSGKDTPVIAKIERPEAIKNLKDIIVATDAVMVARGDLGVEMPPELVPPLQKRIIKLCNAYKKPVITATQMLESMVRNPRPTRAEASDVAGAVFDGTDALMLSEETAAGEYPVASVLMMDRVAREAERYAVFPDLETAASGHMEAIASSACRCAEELKAKAIICFTRSGATALHISKSRPPAAIIAATPDKRVMRKMRLYYGVIPVLIKLRENTDRIIKEVEDAALSRRLVREGDLIILTLGVPAADSPTNLMKIQRVGEGFR
jgi:pyruvate kinase